MSHTVTLHNLTNNFTASILTTTPLKDLLMYPIARRVARMSSARVLRSTKHNSGISPSAWGGIGPQRRSTMPAPEFHGLNYPTTYRTTSPPFSPGDENSGLIAERCASPEPEPAPGSCYDGFIHCSKNPLSRRYNGGDVVSSLTCQNSSRYSLSFLRF